MHRKVWLTLAAAGAIALTGMPSVAQVPADPAAAVEYRQSVMRTFGGALRATASFVRGEGGTLEGARMAILAAQAAAPLIPHLFVEGSGQGTGDSRALPAIWENMGEVETMAGNVDAALTNLMVAAFSSDDVAVIGAALGPTGQACGACHNTYRAE